MSIYLFCEGQTEKNVVAHFTTLANPNSQGQGKAQVNNEMVNTLGVKLTQGKMLRVLVMRDVDQDESPESIVQSVTHAVQKMLRERDFPPISANFVAHDQHPNVYELTLNEHDLRIALHLATYKWHEGFVNATIDDYVLALALHETTTQAFINGKKWTIKPEQIIRKVTDRIPTLLQENGISLHEAKAYVRLYAALVQAHTSPQVFAQKTMSNASAEDKHAIFAPLLAALGFLGAK